MSAQDARAASSARRWLPAWNSICAAMDSTYDRKAARWLAGAVASASANRERASSKRPRFPSRNAMQRRIRARVIGSSVSSRRARVRGVASEIGTGPNTSEKAIALNASPTSAGLPARLAHSSIASAASPPLSQAD